MLLRIAGGMAGIEAYLKTGRKLGREQTRDELDERVTLCGDLDAVAAAIKLIPAKRERYLHLTLSFRELEVDVETLGAIAREFEEFCRTAYRKDEMVFFAEAHLPRIQSLTDKATGEKVERLAHIHVVIPKVNLATGMSLNPLGKVARQVPYLDAFQETVNARYGLASPKDHQRTGFHGRAHVLERSLGDEFTGAHKALKSQILASLVGEGIRNPEDFEQHLHQFGEVRTRNAGSDKPYFNVKLPGAEKGINLREFVFSAEFLSWSVARRREYLEKPQEPQSMTVERSSPASPSAAYLELLRQWTLYRAREVKYINSGNRTQWTTYQMLNEEAKMKVLKDKETKFYSKVDAIKGAPVPIPTSTHAVAPPRVVSAADTTLGQLALDEVNRVLDQAAKGRMSSARLTQPFEEFVRDLETAQAVSGARRVSVAKAYGGGAKAVYEHLRRHIHWEPYRAWVYMVRHGMVQVDPAQTVSHEVHQQLIRKHRVERDRLNKESLTEAQRKARLSQLQMTLVLEQKYLWGRAQDRLQQERARDLEFELTSENSLRPTEIKPPKVVHPGEVFKPQDWSHRIETTGAVTYFRSQATVLQDQGAQIAVVAFDDQALDVALRLAVAKYGSGLTVKGSDDFKQRIVHQAARMSLRIVLSDAELQKSLEQLRAAQYHRKGMEY